PKIIFAPNKTDRHPDHGHCSEIVKEAVFSAGIKKYSVESDYDSFKPNELFYYQINGIMTPHFVIDIFEFIDQKMEALACYKSQFLLSANQVTTP
ncbi:hypothetical protein, partial [Pseudomonas sp. 2822-17]|uniref:hypothetical protein n=1 Tax=Pseudomonas sp. 2822-17 TaxID=1712678 RepID=UPI001C49080A